MHNLCWICVYVCNNVYVGGGRTQLVLARVKSFQRAIAGLLLRFSRKAVFSDCPTHTQHSASASWMPGHALLSSSSSLSRMLLYSASNTMALSDRYEQPHHGWRVFPHPAGPVLSFREKGAGTCLLYHLKAASSGLGDAERLQVPGRIIVSYPTGQTQLGKGVPDRHLGTSWEN